MIKTALVALLAALPLSGCYSLSALGPPPGTPAASCLRNAADTAFATVKPGAGEMFNKAKFAQFSELRGAGMIACAVAGVSVIRANDALAAGTLLPDRAVIAARQMFDSAMRQTVAGHLGDHGYKGDGADLVRDLTASALPYLPGDAEALRRDAAAWSKVITYVEGDSSIPTGKRFVDAARKVIAAQDIS